MGCVYNIKCNYMYIRIYQNINITKKKHVALK